MVQPPPSVPDEGSPVVCQHQAPGLARHARALRQVLAITGIFMVAEVVGGVLANSLALLADAVHMLTDVSAVGLSLFVAWIAQRPATPERTFGYLRLEILAAFVNGAALFIIAGGIVWEAIERMGSPPEVRPGLMFGVASAGLVANLVAMRLLHRGHRHSLNVRGAYLHVVSDMLGSVGAMLAGLIVLTTGWTLADPIASVIIALLVLGSAWNLVRESVDVLLEATPRNLSLLEVERALSQISGVCRVHDLHVWTVTSGVVAMSGHAVVADPSEHQRVLDEAHTRLEELGINHITIQLEGDESCRHLAVTG